MTRVASGAASAVGNIRSRMEGEMRDQVERLLQRMNLVTREEHEVVAALAAAARSEQEILARRVAALGAKLGTKPSAPKKAVAAAKAAKPSIKTAKTAVKAEVSMAKPKAAAAKPKAGRQRRPRVEA
jgi:BMFP domain-containing protein YqiC